MKQVEMDQQIIGYLPDPQVQSEERPWGRWSVLAEADGYKVKRLEIAPGQRLSLQYHLHRSEHWVVVSGSARVVLGEETRDIRVTDSVVVPAKMIHRIENPYVAPVVIIEIQQGTTLDEDDIVRLEDDYQRIAINRRNQQ